MKMRLEEKEWIVEDERWGGENIWSVVVKRVVWIIDRFEKKIGKIKIELDKWKKMVVEGINVGRVRIKYGLIKKEMGCKIGS